MRRPYFRHPGMPLQRWIADPARGTGDTADGIAGDCFRTALAGALGLPRDTVPHFANYTAVDAGWWWELQRWARETYGATIYACNPDLWREFREAGRTDLRYPGGGEYVVVGGPSPRGSFGHAVVANLDLDVVHDPHPLGMGLTSIMEVYRFAIDTDGWVPPARRELVRGKHG